MQRTCRVQTTVTGGKLAASGGKLHTGLGSNGFWYQENCARREGGNKGTIKAFSEQGQSTGAFNYHLGCSVHASYIDYRELHVAAVQSFKLIEGSGQVSYHSHSRSQPRLEPNSK